MSVWTSIADFRQYSTNLPAGAEQDALIQVSLDRSEALCGRYLTGIVIDAPAPEDLKQVVLEKAYDIYLTRGTASLQELVGIEGQGEITQITSLTGGQKAALRQIAVDLFGVAF